MEPEEIVWQELVKYLGSGVSGGAIVAVVYLLIGWRKARYKYDIDVVSMLLGRVESLEKSMVAASADHILAVQKCHEEHEACLNENRELRTSIGILQIQVGRLEGQSGPTAVISCDSKGIIYEWNPEATILFGFDQAEAIGMEVTRLVPPDLRGDHDEGFKNAITTRDLDDESFKLRHSFALCKDGSRVPVRIKIHKFQHRGEVCFTAMVNRR